MPQISEPFRRQEYPGLNSAESDILRNYLTQRDKPVVSLATRQVVGPGEQLDDAQPESFRRSWQESSKYKIDAVVERPDAIELVELKDFLRTSYIGQLKSYRYWYEIERDPQKPLQLWAVGPDINPTAVQPTVFEGINLWLTTVEGERHEQQGRVAQPPF